jgi:hypothetical protein
MPNQPAPAQPGACNRADSVLYLVHVVVFARQLVLARSCPGPRPCPRPANPGLPKQYDPTIPSAMRIVNRNTPRPSLAGVQQASDASPSDAHYIRDIPPCSAARQ